MLLTSTNLADVISQVTTIMWFRRDLRLADNAALYHALREQQEVLPLFIFDTGILDDLDKDDRRVEFIHLALGALHGELEKLGSSIAVLMGKPLEIFEALPSLIVYANEDYEPAARERDKAVADLLSARGGALKTYKDQVIFSKDEVMKADGKPYTVFTPYCKKWKDKLAAFYLKSYPVEKYVQHLKRMTPLAFPSLAETGFKETGAAFPGRIIMQSVVSQYTERRNFPAVQGTSRLGVHLRFGTISIRGVAQLAQKKNATWLSELIWRDFYQMILWHFPHSATRSFKPAYDRIIWRNNLIEFELWCQGKTGYPIVDAGMRELNVSGFMHNRVRMITASFLTKHLLVDWRWGEAYFAKKLLDYDLAANNGGWQWAAGSGCDAAPYFRVFNPQLQTEKFDRDLLYIRKWVPEFGTPAYPAPMVEHRFARERAISCYKHALNE